MGSTPAGCNVQSAGLASRLTEVFQVEESSQLREKNLCGLQLDVLFGQLTSHSPDGFWFLEIPSERYLYLSEGVARIWGRQVADFFESPDLCNESVHPEDRGPMETAWKSWLKSGDPSIELEYRVLHADGKVIWVQDSSGKILGADGSVAFVCGVARDITERKEADAALNSRSMFEEEINHISTVLVNARGEDFDAIIPDILRRVGEFFNVDRSYMFLLNPQGTFDNTHEWCAPGIEAQIQNLQAVPLSAFPKIFEELSHGKNVCIESVGDLPQDWTEDRANLITQDILSLVSVPMTSEGRWIGLVGFDSVRQHRAWTEDEIRLLRVLADLLAGATLRIRIESELIQSEGRFRALFDTMFQFLCVLDSEGRLRHVNEAAVLGLGRPAAELEGQFLWASGWWDFHGSDPDLVRGWISDAAGGQMVRGETQMRAANGTMLYVDFSMKAVKEEVGADEWMIFEARDITEKKSMERRILRTQRMESLGTLSSGIAHDLNNVFAPIQSAVDLLWLERIESEKHLLDVIESATARGAGMVRQLLTFARGVDGERQEVSCAALLDEVLRICEHTFPKEIKIVCSPPEEEILVQVDTTQIHQVLLNLCLNARDAMEHGGELTLGAFLEELSEEEAGRLELGAGGTYAVLSVRDTGQGIAPELIERIFEPFFTTKSAERGSGLGLSSSLGIVNSHGGRLLVDTRAGEGSHFRVYLPAHDGAESADPVDSEPAENRRVKGLHVLLVDDEEPIRSTLGSLLEFLGFEVSTECNGARGLEHFRREVVSTDLLIADVHMPEMDGVTMIAEIRKLRPGLPVVVCSGNPDDQILETVRSLPHCVFLAKPFRLQALQQALESLGMLQITAPKAG